MQRKSDNRLSFKHWFLVIISSNKALRVRTREQAAKMRGAEEIRIACDPRDGCIVIIHEVFTCDIYKTLFLKSETQGWFLLRLNNTVHLSKLSGRKSRLEEFG